MPFSPEEKYIPESAEVRAQGFQNSVKLYLEFVRSRVVIDGVTFNNIDVGLANFPDRRDLVVGVNVVAAYGDQALLTEMEDKIDELAIKCKGQKISDECRLSTNADEGTFGLCQVMSLFYGFK